MQHRRSLLLGLKQLVLICLLLLTASARHAAASQPTPSIPSEEINQRVMAALPTWQGKSANTIDQLDLTGPFATRTQWTFVAATLPGSFVDAAGNTIDHGTLAVCFVDGLTPRCKYAQPGTTQSSWLSDADNLFSAVVAFAGADHADPLLLVMARSQGSADGDHSIYTQVYMYDKPSNQFRSIFSNETGSNNNQRTRFVEDGPLRGDIIVDEPTESAPFAYWISVYAWNKETPYSHVVLRYRSATHYGDGNPLPVIDSEMPNILKRLGKWKSGDPLPIPPQSTCMPYLRGGGEEEWCR